VRGFLGDGHGGGSSVLSGARLWGRPSFPSFYGISDRKFRITGKIPWTTLCALSKYSESCLKISFLKFISSMIFAGEWVFSDRTMSLENHRSTGSFNLHLMKEDMPC
jgi:hypothetical protein